MIKNRSKLKFGNVKIRLIFFCCHIFRRAYIFIYIIKKKKYTKFKPLCSFGNPGPYVIHRHRRGYKTQYGSNFNFHDFNSKVLLIDGLIPIEGQFTLCLGQNLDFIFFKMV